MPFVEKGAVFLRLDIEAINQQISSQQLKRWWIAEFTGVHKTTLRRWLKGHIEKVAEAHVGRLAEVLTVRPGDISFPVEPLPAKPPL